MKRILNKLAEQKIFKPQNRQNLIALSVVGLIALAGIVFLVRSHAATSTVALEAENGSLSGGAVAVADSTASGGSYVRFGGNSTGDTTPPTVTLTAPSTATVSTTVAISAAATDNVGVTKVEFYQGGTLIATDSTPPTPFTANWSVPGTNGTYSLTAKAYDAAGNVGTSPVKAVTVSGGGGGTTANATTPCVSAPAPAQWKHVVVLMFENQKYSSIIGSATTPYISSLAPKCGSYANWYDADFTVTGAAAGAYHSKPNYATLTSGVKVSVHGLLDDTYSTVSNVDNIMNRLKNAGMNSNSYVDGSAGSCATGNFVGAYHDAMRYYSNLGGKSSSPTTYCNQHDKSVSSFMTDVNSGALPELSIIYPTNNENMHGGTVSAGDAWAKAFLPPLLNSARYASGDTAIFFLWDEDKPIPNILLAPSIRAGTHPATPVGNPISHYSALRTWQEMLGITPLLGDTGSAPSLLNYYNGK